MQEFNIPETLNFETREWRRDVSRLIPWDNRNPCCLVIVCSKERLGWYRWCASNDDAARVALSFEKGDYMHVFWHKGPVQIAFSTD